MSRFPNNTCIKKELDNKCGGEGGIRTLDELLTHTHFPGVLLKPLGRLSVTIEGNPTIRTPASESEP